MPRFIPLNRIDDELDALIGDATTVAICTDQPADFAGIAAVRLGEQAITGPITKANGDTSGRKAIIPTQPDITYAANGDGDYVVYHNGSEICLITTMPVQSGSIGSQVTLSTHDIEIFQVAA